MEVGADIIVKGLVQGVGFRFFVYRIGKSLNLVGTVENLSGGVVKIVVEGDRSAIEEMIRFVKVGPRSAEVNDVVIHWTSPKHSFPDFTIL